MFSPFASPGLPAASSAPSAVKPEEAAEGEHRQDDGRKSHYEVPALRVRSTRVRRPVHRATL